MFRVGIVSEGPSDHAIIEAILDNYLNDYRSTAIQPPISNRGGDSGPLGGGWKGVRLWCQQESQCEGGLRQSSALENHDLVVIHLDADVAAEPDINCAQPCPPPSSTCYALRSLLMQWLNVNALPANVLLCVPAQATESWALVALFPDYEAVLPCTDAEADAECIECRRDIKGLLRSLGKKLRPKLVVSQDGQLKNQAKGFREQSGKITRNWERVVHVCSEASRLDSELQQLLP
jgi:hypothetical protein